MSARRSEIRPIAFLLLTGCQPGHGEYFDSLTDAWAAQTLDSAGPSITAALMIAGMTHELCLSRESGVTWSADDVNGPPSMLSDALLSAMGNPTVDTVEISDDSTAILLASVRIMDRESAFVRFVPTSGGSDFSLTAEVRDGREIETFGSLTFTISDCSGDDRWVSGNAKWTDLSGIDHTITIPADETDIGLDFDCAYGPSGGTLSWSGTLDGQLRQFTTAEAAEISWVYGEDGRAAESDAEYDAMSCEKFNGLTALEWSGTVTGGQDDWSTTTTLDILQPE